MSEVGERMKGGAVNEDKSPENEAILINERERWLRVKQRAAETDQDEDLSARFQEGAPGSALIGWYGLWERWRGC